MIARRRAALFSGVGLMAVAATLSAQTPRPMSLVDLINVPQIAGPQLSPDGRTLVFVRSDANWEANKRISQLWRIQADGTDLIQLTYGAEGASNPRWSPDGRAIAFLAKRNADDKTQIYLLPLDGGEARPITKHATDVSNITWSPDGQSLFFLAADEKTAEEKARDELKDDVYAFDEDYKQRHLWRVSVATGAGERLTQGDYSVMDYALSRDGRRVALHRGPTPLFGDFDQAEVWAMDAGGGNAVRLTSNRVTESGASLSPDNSQVLFLSASNASFEPYYNDKIFVVPANGGTPRVLMPDVPYEINEAHWSKDGRSIFFLANMGVHSELFEVAVAGGRPRQLTDGQHALGGWQFALGADRHVFTRNEPASNGDVWTIPVSGGELTRITRVFEDLAKRFKLPRQERIEWKGADGVTVEGLLYYPLEYKAGQRYPLVVQTHGGPAASDKFGFGSWGSYVQVLAARGYAVLKPNYRGSTGYGDPFLRDMVGSYFKNSHVDVMTGVDHLIKLGVADGDRLVKMGWSGGGHMTNKIITFTERFKAASSGAGAGNWVSMYAQSDVRTYRTPWFGGTPWQKEAPIDLYWEHSPLKYVANVTTPTIFLVGEKDVRVPPPQSVEMYRALKSNGVPTRLYIAPREPHGWQELRHQLFKMNVELDWFETHAMKRDYTWEKAPEGKKKEADKTSQ